MAKWFNASDARYRKLMHTRRWRELRKKKLVATVWCEDCRAVGRNEIATEVHHLTPILSTDHPALMEKLAYDYHNLRALCHRCHCRRHSIKWVDKKAQAMKEAEQTRKLFIARFFGQPDEGDGKS